MYREIYQAISGKAGIDATVEKVVIGLNWTVAVVTDTSGHRSAGLCYSPADVGRTLSWPGTLAGKPVNEILPWQLRWNSAESAVGTAVMNAAINLLNPLQCGAMTLSGSVPGHLQVFEHFFPLITEVRANNPVVVIGHYPGIERYSSVQKLSIIEKNPQKGDLPEAAAEFLLPQASWVFITASSLANKTLPRLLELAIHAKVVLMGPSLPWFTEWRNFGVNYLAGVSVNNIPHLLDIVSEGGGTRIFDSAVGYKLLEL